MKKIVKKSLLVIVTIGILVLVYLFSAIVPGLVAKRGFNLDGHQGCLLVAHRGGAGLGIENTLDCIARGMETRADMIEVDIHLTKDGHIVVCHDQSVDRMTDGKGLIRDMTLAQLRQLNVIDANDNPTGYKIPTLEEVMALVDGHKKLLIEIKRTGGIYAGIEDKLVEMLYDHDALDWCVVQSFNDSVLDNIHAIAPDIRLEKLLICKLPLLPVIFDGTFQWYDLKRYSYVKSFNFYYLAASSDIIDELHENGREVKVWTLDGPDSTPDMPYDGVISDRPDLF